MERLTTEIWIGAHVRRCAVEGIGATVVRKGDPIGGAAATGRRDPRAPGHLPEKPAGNGLAAP